MTDQEKYMENIAIAKDPRTSPDTLAQLAQEVSGPGASVVLGYIAQHLNTSPNVLERLGDWTRTTGSKKWGLYTDTSVQSAVARNPNTPDETRSRLLCHDDWLVRLNARWGKIYAILNKNASLDRLKDLDTEQEDQALWKLEADGIVVEHDDVYRLVPPEKREKMRT